MKGNKGSGNSKSILKPPRSVPKLTSLPTVPSDKDSSRSIQIKKNTRRTSSGTYSAHDYITCKFSYEIICFRICM